MTANTNVTSQFDLYLDESGSFMETSKIPSERAVDDQNNPRKFPSQLAGLLVPRGALTEETAEDILDHCHNTVGWTLPNIVHLKDYWKDPDYNPTQDPKAFNRNMNDLIDDLLQQLPKDFQPVRLVNAEAVSYGMKPEYYTNMVAELFVRLCRQKQKEGHRRISIRLMCAEVLVTVPRTRLLSKDEYKLRLQEHITWAAVRRGFPVESNDWELEDLDIVDANISSRLQLCDIISYASHDNFKRINYPTAQRFQKALEGYNWTLQLRELLERVEQLREEGSLGSALIALVESFIRKDTTEVLLKEAESEKDKLLDELADLVAPVRDSQLAVILSWLEQIITLKRAADLGYNVASWLRLNVEASLRSRMTSLGKAAELDWFSFALIYWALTASNHTGSLQNARKAAQELNNLIRPLAGSWEHTPLLMEGLVALAVHETDCLEFTNASTRMELVVAHYEDLAKLFPSAMPNLFSSKVRSDLKAKALGTWLQSEILAGAGRTYAADKTRKISEEAIDEFRSQDDKERQYQYRSQLECLDHKFAVAREYLTRSLRISDDSHDAISGALVNLHNNHVAQGFGLMHWLRIGAVSLMAGDMPEFSSFISALEQSQLLSSSWCEGREEEYPVHSILRRVAFINAGRGKIEQALVSLDKQRSKTGIKGRLILGVILLAAYAEVSAFLWRDSYANAMQLLDTEGERPGIKQLASAMLDHSQEFPAISEFMSRCLSTVEEVKKLEAGDESPPQRLIEIGQLVSY